ncbi:MAG: sigma factor, partial [Phycisphaerales bacterium]
MDPSTRRALADWTRAQPAVSAFVHALVHDRAERDDVLQDVAVAVLESQHRYDPARPFLAWALAIARNEVVDSLRRRRRRPALLGPDAADALADAIADVAEGDRARTCSRPGGPGEPARPRRRPRSRRPAHPPHRARGAPGAGAGGAATRRP